MKQNVCNGTLLFASGPELLPERYEGRSMCSSKSKGVPGASSLSASKRWLLAGPCYAFQHDPQCTGRSDFPPRRES